MSDSRRNFLKSLGATALLPALSAFNGSRLEEPSKAAYHRVLCCNIRVALDEDEAKGVGWTARKEICLRVIREQKAGYHLPAGSTESAGPMISGTISPLISCWVLTGPEMDPHPTGYYGIAKNPILFSKKRYELMQRALTGFETPLVAGSKSWDTARARHANWGAT